MQLINSFSHAHLFSFYTKALLNSRLWLLRRHGFIIYNNNSSHESAAAKYMFIFGNSNI